MVTKKEMEDVFSLMWRMIMYKRTGNGVYAAQAWKIARRIGVLDDWLLSAVDAAAESGYFYSTVATGRGKNNDKKAHSTDRTELIHYIGEACPMWEDDRSLSQAKIAAKLNVDPAQFSRVLKKYESEFGPFPWKAR